MLGSEEFSFKRIPAAGFKMSYSARYIPPATGND